MACMCACFHLLTDAVRLAYSFALSCWFQYTQLQLKHARTCRT